MSENMNKMMELLKQNPELQEKLMAALKAMGNDASLETILKDVFAPIAQEAGIALTAEDIKDFADSMPEDAALSTDDLKDVNGGMFLGMIPAIGKMVSGIVTVINKIKETPKPVKVEDQWKDENIL